ncbi:ras GEF [Dendrothele bispora CBS 962.96]|uniref:Ras GEF n=1 Tax=Dendrothele bispora (strain CBS 962.96) TaxID=1314807 RepID=A0A4V4HHP2_DENBC|nr:ras GEF [Dendrothele bispora CBS 962.96]
MSSSPPVLPFIPDIASTGLDFSSPESFDSALPALTSSPSSPDVSSHQVLLPIPAPSNNRSQASFTYPDTNEDDEPLPPEIANADISIAPDGSFVETSNGQAAIELRKRFDKHYGVGPSVRSPYAITTFVNQHGKQIHRIGHRDQPAPGATAAQTEDLVASKSSKSPTTSPQHPKRQSRLSFLRNGSSSSSHHHHSTGAPSGPSPGPRKLKKPRSNPDLTGPSHHSYSNSHPSSRYHHGSSIGGRMHSLSVTAADMPRTAYTNNNNNSQHYNHSNNNSHVHLHQQQQQQQHHGDAFGEVMGWSNHPSSSWASTSSSSNPVLSSPSSSQHLSSHYNTGSYNSNNNYFAHGQSHSGFPTFIKYPFGSGVSFDSPAAKTGGGGQFLSDNEDDEKDGSDGAGGSVYPHLPIPRPLREIKSFESGLTARQVEHEREESNEGTEEMETDKGKGKGKERWFLDDDDHDLGRPPSAIHLRDSYLLAGMISTGREKGKEKEKEEQDEEKEQVPEQEPEPEPEVEPGDDPGPAIVQEDYPLPETSLHSRYNTDIFDVLQTYRGLPLLDRLDLDPNSDSDSERGRGRDEFETIVIKMSLSSENNAAPKDDPRFVIWGEVYLRGDGDHYDESQSQSHSQSRESLELSSSSKSGSGIGTGTSGTSGNGTGNGTSGTASGSMSKTMSMSISKRKSHAKALGAIGDGDGSNGGDSRGKSHSPSRPRRPLRLTSSALLGVGGEEEGRKRVLVAATIERWIAQLTSDLNYDELLNFFLTYRTYINSLDLAHLLIARFHWALQKSSSTATPTTSVGGRMLNGKENGNKDKGKDQEQDDFVRRIVRVRTFVAWRYWLLTFFTVDFVPNRELRLLVASWLNTLARDPILERCKDAASIVQKLKKVAKDCVKAHTRTLPKPKPKARPSSSSTLDPSSFSKQQQQQDQQQKPPKELLLGEKFAEATRKLKKERQDREEFFDDSDSEVDLDLAMDEGSSSPTGYNQADPSSLNSPLGNMSMGMSGPIHLGGTSLSPSNLSILQRTDHAPGPDSYMSPYAPNSSGTGTGAGAGEGGSNGIGAPMPLPIHHNALSRVLVKTIGRLGRWKRVLNNRTVFPGGGFPGAAAGSGAGGGYSALCSGVSAFDLELTISSRDLLTVNGGVESYLRMIEQNQGINSDRERGRDREEQKRREREERGKERGKDVLLSSAATQAAVSPTTVLTQPSPSSLSPSLVVPPGLSTTSDTAAEPEPQTEPEVPVSEESTVAPPIPDGPPPGYSESVHDSNDSHSINAPTTSTHEIESSSQVQRDQASLAARSIRSSSSTDSFGEPLSASRSSAAFPGFRPPWEFDVVSIDELDLSDTSSEQGVDVDGPAMPPGLRRPPRRQPLRRDFEFLDRRDTVSSMGIISRDSVASEASSRASSSSTTSNNSIVLGGNIHQWQLNELVKSLEDEEEPGDVEDALKRLEGQINPQKKQEKLSKVDGWVKSIRERLAAGDYSDEAPRMSDDEDDDGDDEDYQASSPSNGRDTHIVEDGEQTQIIPSISEPEGSAEGSYDDGGNDNVSTPVVAHASSQFISLPRSTTDAKPAVEDVVPLEILQSRLSDMPPLSTRVASITSKFADHDVPRAHRSFILGFKADDLAQHFAMIDRELFMNIKFDELLLDDWAACEEVNVLDWAQYLKDRARWKAESRWPEKTSALGCVRGRFNLMVNFVVSEIVLTSPPERPLVFARFLRIAWKAYQRSSFNTLVAIITGLQSEWVTKAMRKGMSRLTLWESRMFADFKAYISNVNNYEYIRHAVDAIADAKPLNSTNHTASVVSGSGDQSGKGKSGLDKPIVPACIPFIGIYLSQLHQHNQLPPLIDPTAPNKAIGFDPVSSNFDPVAHPEVFSTLAPLPSSINLEPLINVHKQRLIADVIKSLVAGQHLASRVQFPVEKKLFHKCLRLRGLDPETLQRALLMLSD